MSLLLRLLTPAVTPTATPVSFSDSVQRPKFAAHLQQALAFVVLVQQLTPVALTSHPDRVQRPNFAPQHQLAASELPPQPEQKIARDWLPLYQDRIVRPVVPTTEQPYFAFCPRQPIEFVQVASNDPQVTGVTSVAATFASAQRAGDLIVVATGVFTVGGNVLNVTDLAGNVYQQCVPRTDSLLQSQEIWYARNIAAASPGSNTVTATYVSAVDFPDIRILQYHGCDPDNPFDIGTGASGVGTTADSGNVTTRTAEEVLVGAGMTEFHYNGAGTNYVSRVITPTDKDIAEDRIVSTAGTYNATADNSGGDWLFQIATFRIAGWTEATTPFTVYPDRAARSLTPVREQPVSSPFLTAPVAQVFGWDPTFPGRLIRPWLPIGNQLSFGISSAPERTSPIAIEWHVDRLVRPALSVVQQLASTELSPQPERTSALVSEAHDDRVTRPTFQARQQLAVTELSPQPERTSPLAAEWHVDRAVRPTFSVTEQQAVTELSPQPERTSILWSEWQDDRLYRPNLPAHQQLAVSEISPQPEQTIALAWSPTYPERANRPYVQAAQQPGFSLWPVPILNAPATPYVWYPDGVVRPLFPAREQQYFAPSPQPERTSPLADEWRDDRLTRPFFQATQQLAVTELSPAPERTSPLAVEVHPDRPVRPILGAAWQLAVTELSPQPERTSSLADERHNDSVWRPSFRVHNQLAVTELSPKPELTVALAWVPTYPEKAVRPVTRRASDQAFFTFWPQPIAAGTTQTFVCYPDGVVRPKFLSGSQQALALAPQPERTSPIAVEVHADQPWRPSFRVVQQLAVTELSPKPERTSPLVSEVHSDRPTRPALHVSQQLAVTEISPQPIAPLIFGYDPVYPSRVLRAKVGLANHQYFTTSNVFSPLNGTSPFSITATGALSGSARFIGASIHFGLTATGSLGDPGTPGTLAIEHALVNVAILPLDIAEYLASASDVIVNPNDTGANISVNDTTEITAIIFDELA
jgi:hypothetical protein